MHVAGPTESGMPGYLNDRCDDMFVVMPWLTAADVPSYVFELQLVTSLLLVVCFGVCLFILCTVCVARTNQQNRQVPLRTVQPMETTYADHDQMEKLALKLNPNSQPPNQPRTQQNL